MQRSIIAGVLIVTVALPAVAHAQATIDSSLPLSGAAAGQTRAIYDGARQALQEAGGTAIRLVTLNEATRRAGTWTPGRVAAQPRA